MIAGVLAASLAGAPAVVVDVEPRRKLQEAGLSFTPWFVSDAIVLPEDQAVVGLGMFEARVALDLERLLGWSGLSLELAPLFLFGDAPSGRLGDLQAIDNIEAMNGVSLFEGFLRARYGPVKVEFGFIDLNRLIDVLPRAELFIHSTAGYGAVLGNLRPNGGLSFPTTSLTLAGVLELESWTASLLIADGIPGQSTEIADTPVRPPRTSLRLGGRDGVLAVAELAWTGWGKWALGGWASSTNYGRERQTGGGGGWIGFGLPLLPRRDRFQGATLFFRAGLGTPDASIFEAELGGGLVFDGVIWRSDAVGVAAFGARGSEVDRWETAYELTYRARLIPGLAVQPFLTWINQPLQGDSSLAVGARLDLHP